MYDGGCRSKWSRMRKTNLLKQHIDYKKTAMYE